MIKILDQTKGNVPREIFEDILKRYNDLILVQNSSAEKYEEVVDKYSDLVDKYVRLNDELLLLKYGDNK